MQNIYVLANNNKFIVGITLSAKGFAESKLQTIIALHFYANE